REAGNRSKIAVSSTMPNVDPVGACVGPRGMRVQTIVQELRGEKIDIVAWDPVPPRFIANALRPARVLRVFVNEEEKSARAVVPDHQLSLAIGREGQNARLAARLTGWKIDIKSDTQMAELALLEAQRKLEARQAAAEAVEDEEPVVEVAPEPAVAVEAEDVSEAQADVEEEVLEPVAAAAGDVIEEDLVEEEAVEAVEVDEVEPAEVEDV